MLAKVDAISPFSQIFGYLGIVLFVFALAYISTKFLAKFKMGTKLGQIKLIDRCFIASDKSILLVKCKQKEYLILSDKQGLKLLDKMDSSKEFESDNKDDSVKFDGLK